MPTGYTAKLVEKDQSFNDFVLTCARGMGALIMMRDEPMDAPIRDFEPSDYELKQLHEAKAEHEKLLAMSDAKRIAFGEAEKRRKIKQREEWLAKEGEENRRLLEMQALVTAWNPPTSEHVGLKQFMLQQIEISLHDLNYVRDDIKKLRAKFARDFYDDALKTASDRIPYYEEEDRKERERTAGRNRWVAELKASLP